MQNKKHSYKKTILQSKLPISGSENSIKEWIIRAWPLIPATLYLFGFLIIVLLYLLELSFTSSASEFPTLKSFVDLFNDIQFKHALTNTTLFAIIGTPLELLAGIVVALLVYRTFVFRGLVQSIFLIPLAIPALVTAMLLYVLFDFPGGHINNILMGNYPLFPKIIEHPISWRGSSFFAMSISMLGKIWRDMPISMLIILAGFNNIDPELFDAAKTMGASLRQRLFSIIIPLIMPSISAVVLLRSVEMWKEFIFPFVLSGRNRLLGTLIDFYYNSLGNAHMAAAVAIVMVVCIIITTVILMKVMEILQKSVTRR